MKAKTTSGPDFFFFKLLRPLWAFWISDKRFFHLLGSWIHRQKRFQIWNVLDKGFQKKVTQWFWWFVDRMKESSDKLINFRRCFCSFIKFWHWKLESAWNSEITFRPRQCLRNCHLGPRSELLHQLLSSLYSRVAITVLEVLKIMSATVLLKHTMRKCDYFDAL